MLVYPSLNLCLDGFIFQQLLRYQLIFISSVVILRVSTSYSVFLQFAYSNFNPVIFQSIQIPDSFENIRSSLSSIIQQNIIAYTRFSQHVSGFRVCRSLSFSTLNLERVFERIWMSMFYCILFVKSTESVSRLYEQWI